MSEETTPLLVSDRFRPELQEKGNGGSPCGCSCAKLLAICRRKQPREEDTFSSAVGMMLSMLGSAVGTGNIWRFPRILANHADQGGALSFLLVWACFLWLFSIPLIILQYGVGRYTKKSVIESFGTLLGPSYRFLGGFPVVVNICTGGYYAVLLGWCGYYFIYTCANTLPSDFEMSNNTWNNLQDSNWPILCHTVGVIAAGLAVSRGVSTIEPVNNVIVPILLLIIVFSFYWALYLPFASTGITHMFHPSWSSLKDSKLWMDALAQNAWDTGAAGSVLLTYATYMKRSHGAVKFGTITPIINNVVSLLCGILVFCTVFSVRQQEGYDKEYIVELIQSNGPANTGLTFIWFPILYSTINGGRFLAAMFFLCLTLAGFSSLISIIELPVHCLADFGICRIPATIITCLAVILVGLGSAININVFVNQDTVWGYALIIAGCFLVFLALRYGVLKFRQELYNQFGIGDWSLPWVWVIVLVFIVPVEGVGLIVWYIVDEIRDNPGTWWKFSVTSLAMVLSQWAFAILLMIGLNRWLKPLKITTPKNFRWKKILGAIFKLQDPPVPTIESTLSSTLLETSMEPNNSVREGDSMYTSSGVVIDVDV